MPLDEDQTRQLAVLSALATNRYSLDALAKALLLPAGHMLAGRKLHHIVGDLLLDGYIGRTGAGSKGAYHMTGKGHALRDHLQGLEREVVQNWQVADDTQSTLRVENTPSQAETLETWKPVDETPGTFTLPSPQEDEVEFVPKPTRGADGPLHVDLGGGRAARSWETPEDRVLPMPTRQVTVPPVPTRGGNLPQAIPRGPRSEPPQASAPTSGTGVVIQGPLRAAIATPVTELPFDEAQSQVLAKLIHAIHNERAHRVKTDNCLKEIHGVLSKYYATN